jgi:hypothetical protein
MYKIIVNVIFIVLNFSLSASFAQDFTFKQPTIKSYPKAPSSRSMLPSREPVLSAEGFAKSTDQAYQAQQAKVAAVAAQVKNEEKMNQAKQAASSKASPDAQKSLTPAQTLTQPTQSMPPQDINPVVTPPPAQTPAAQSAPSAQPYTGFQSTPSNIGGNTGGNTGGSAPTNNEQNSTGWGSGIKY